MEQIQASVDRLTALSSEILGIARSNVSEKNSVNLARVLGEEIAKWQIFAKKNKVLIAGNGPDCNVCIDLQRFVSAIDNIFANSIESLVNSKVKGKIEVTWTPSAKGVIIKVADNGKGISKKVINKIFDPFFSHGKAFGTGLGMTAVKRFVEIHNGNIDVDSKVGKGTTITISIPNSDGKLQECPSLNSQESAPSNGKTKK